MSILEVLSSVAAIWPLINHHPFAKAVVLILAVHEILCPIRQE
jgi:hypothetical protein